MTRIGRRPDVDQVLATLKDFQRATVEHVFDHLYQNAASSHRFLIADEVGLGKTLVARGVIAKAIDHIWDDVDRIDVVYICSNADIARQNIKRLGVGADEFSLPSRITLLPIAVHDLSGHRVNFISFTPNTSFNLRSSLGLMDERALLYLLLRPAWGLGDRSGPLNLLQGHAGRESFRGRVRWLREADDIDKGLEAAFIERIEQHIRTERDEGCQTLRDRFDDLSERFQYLRKHVPDKDRRDRDSLVGDLRMLLAATCLDALEPDLIVLDEFQRFKHLLSDQDASSDLAQQLFAYADDLTNVRVLLLSATPYKMYTTASDTDENHYADFVSTLDFLLRDPAKTSHVEELLRAFRSALFSLGQGQSSALEEVLALKGQVEQLLRTVMVRTERLASTDDRNGMLTETIGDGTKLHQDDLEGYIGLQSVADLLQESDLLGFWKSAPYLLDFMDHYKYKQRFREALESPEQRSRLAAAFATHDHMLFPWQEWRSYQPVDPGNAKLRGLLDQTVDTGIWRLLWIPASLPYYQPAGPFAETMARSITKRLVFSSWQVVPKVISGILSYEAERAMVRSFQDVAENSPEARQRIRPLLRFAISDGRLTGMPVLGLLYPSIALARMGAPLSYADLRPEDSDKYTRLPRLPEVIECVKLRIRESLDDIARPHDTTGPEDESWYWAAPILLDLQADPQSTQAWFDRDELASIWAGQGEDASGDENTRWHEHVAQAREAAHQRLRLGRPPADLADVLTLLAIAGPATSILRSLARRSPSGDGLGPRDDAGRAAWGFRTLFNHPEVTMLVRSLYPDGPYWRRILEYCADGNLQAVLDEYVHLLHEYLGVVDSPPADAATEIADALLQAVSLRTARVSADEISSLDGDQIETGANYMRIRFALRFGDQQSEQSDVPERASAVRAAFNSPFWPFVLATTSVGQEGLDFHLYCHAVVHWNLPSNPVDLEQREGRVHRYKNHAIRKNLASSLGQQVMVNANDDPWLLLFEAAARDRAPGESDLVPYWIFTSPGGAQIQRHVPALPLSQDRERLAALRRSLTYYRMAFGQPRQEDLVEFLIAHVGEDQIESALDELRIDLSPR